MNDVLQKTKDTVKLVFIKSLSTICHELTHYYQATWVEPETYFEAKTEGEMGAYISQANEFESYCVGAYYFFKYYDKKKLKKIMKKKEDVETKRKNLINAYYNTLYPWRPSPFLLK